MKRSRLLIRNLIYYRRTNIPVIAGVAIAVAVLSGALLVGHSVRASLRSLLFERIGATDYVVTADHFFAESLADPAGSGARSCPVIYLKGVLIREKTGVRSNDVHVYGIDARFWKFHGLDMEDFPDPRSAFVGESLARRLGIRESDGLLLRIETQQAIPREWLYGRRDETGKTLRMNAGRILPAASLGEFSLRPTQGSMHCIFVPIARLQRDLNQRGRANTLLWTEPAVKDPEAGIRRSIRSRCTLRDLGLELRTQAAGKAFSLESNRILLDDAIVQAATSTAADMRLDASPVYTYLANSIRARGREIPYSVITAADLGSGAFRATPPPAPGPAAPAGGKPDSPVWLTEWARRDLGVSPGEEIEIEYYLWREELRLDTAAARFRLAGVLPPSAHLDSGLAPRIPGVTDARTVHAWDPPFPLDLKRIRPADEEYWERYNAAPKAFIPLARGRELWESRFGTATAVRFLVPEGREASQLLDPFARNLLAKLDLQAAGIRILPVRAAGLAASAGSTDFGEYFLYFSFFLIAAAVLLAALFFKLLVEQRVQEIGLLRACGFSLPLLRRNFLGEAAFLSTAGSILGLAGSVAYGGLMVRGLRTRWMDAVGTSRIFLNLSWAEMVLGFLCGIVFSVLSLAWTLRALRRNSPRMLLTAAAESTEMNRFRARVLGWVSAAASALAGSSLVLTASGALSQIRGFFGAGFLLLIALLCATARYLRRSHPAPIRGRGMRALWRMGLRNATHRPGRSLFCAGLIAAATFVVVSTEVFRQDTDRIPLEKDSGTGGFSLIGTSTLPILYDLNTAAGQESAGLSPEQSEAIARARFTAFRVRPGDDASCLNLYAPQNPEILGAPAAFLRAGRFSFRESLASTPEQERNPWLLLDSPSGGSVIPAAVDADTLQYILHRSLGDEVSIEGSGRGPVRIRFVAALHGSMLQGKLIISERNFLKTFPGQEGCRYFLVDTPPDAGDAVARLLQEGLADFGFSAEFSRERLASLRRVENTYLSTFQSLGTLGLLLGTVGIATILLRNVLERRRELALLRAVGFPRPHIAGIILAENFFLLAWGLVSGTLCAAIAILPALESRGAAVPFTMAGFIVASVFAVGMGSSLLAVYAAVRAPLLTSLRSE